MDVDRHHCLATLHPPISNQRVLWSLLAGDVAYSPLHAHPPWTLRRPSQACLWATQVPETDVGSPRLGEKALADVASFAFRKSEATPVLLIPQPILSSRHVSRAWRGRRAAGRMNKSLKSPCAPSGALYRHRRRPRRASPTQSVCTMPGRDRSSDTGWRDLSSF